MLYLLDVEIDYARMGDVHPLTEHPLFPAGRSAAPLSPAQAPLP